MKAMQSTRLAQVLLFVSAAALSALLVLFVIPSALAELAPTPRVSSVIFPPQKITLRFSHQKHISQGLSCDYCHENINDSRSGADRNLPPEKTCMGDGCHAIDRARLNAPANAPAKAAAASKASGECVTCHPGFRPPSTGGPDSARSALDSIEKIGLPAPNLKFSHKVHRDRQIRCVVCHGDMSKQELGTRANLPRMTTCLGCHNGRAAPAACTTCHLSLPDGRLRTNFPDGALLPTGQLRGDDHDLTFASQHGRVAHNDRRYCESCHKQSFCLDCHAGDMKPSLRVPSPSLRSNGLSLHGNDYMTIHPIDARKDNPSCAACHKTQTFCVGCHQRLGVGAEPPGPYNTVSGPFTGLFHPPGWSDTVVRGPQHHSWQAQRNMRTCASCHRETFCVACHGTTSRGSRFNFSPHPHSWAGSAFCKSLRDRNERMCLKCHDPYDANGRGDPNAEAYLRCEKP